jgi:hypothetical protein
MMFLIGGRNFIIGVDSVPAKILQSRRRTVGDDDLVSVIQPKTATASSSQCGEGVEHLPVGVRRSCQ